MANHQITIKENITKTLLTEGKYCDRNIDVIVNVPSSGEPTQFTNVLDLDTTIVKNGYRVTSTGYTATTEGVAVVFPITAGTHRLRARGKYTFGFLDYSAYMSNSVGGSGFFTNMYQSNATPTESTFSGTIVANYASFEEKGFIVGIDEYGDTFIDVIITKDCYFGFTLKDMSLVYPYGTFINPIMTIDEPIGNGGIV